MTSTTLPQHTIGSEPPTPPVLLVLRGGRARPCAPQLVPLPRGDMEIGREPVGPGALALTDDPRISRRHARVRWAGDAEEPILEDRGSRNGTFLGGARVVESPLGDGDVLRIGDALLVYRREALRTGDADLPSLIGTSRAMRWLRREIATFAPAGSSVLIRGESGTGKELVARALHALSGRQGDLVAVNCSAIPAALAESELFGHVRGAFTGAEEDRLGLVRAASGGTLFLDEVGDLPLELQPKLLRVLEERQVRPVGATRPVPVDLRVLAATERDLGEAARAGRFRASLLARIGTLSLQTPPLRERREDVPCLLARFLGEEGDRVTPDLLEALLLHPWPLNVRELRAVAEELQLRGAEGGALDLPLIEARLGVPEALRAARGDKPLGAASPAPPPDREALVELLRATGGNVSAVARQSGRSRRQVHRWIARHGLDLARFREVHDRTPTGREPDREGS